IVWVMNMLNWSKGVDGQLAGIAAVGFIVLGVTSLRFAENDPSQTIVALLAFIAAGASLGFLPFNWHPAKIFPGYSSTILGFLIAVLSIMSGAKVAIAVLAMAVPLLDGLFAIVRRLLMKKSPFWGDKRHLHHHLMRLGWGHRKISLFYWTVCAILGLIALTTSGVEKLFAGLLVFCAIIAAILWINLIIWSKEDL
ncbi:MAG TPA: MraY family glycosyltransferase, partial [Gammaproteobacteria bacterium]|nr:MraY family glycosyltransferase [Gammaproteobacteria bacterium]